MSGDRNSGVAFGIVLLAALLGARSAAGQVETVALFNPDALETPESVVMDRLGNLYVSLALTGEIRKIGKDGSQSTHAVLPIGPPLTPCAGFVALIAALAIDPQDTIYVSVGSCILGNRGIWRVASDGTIEQLTQLPDDSFPNGILLRHGELYVADSNLGLIWKLSSQGGPADIWFQDPLLLRRPGGQLPGANGLQFFDGEIYAAVTDTANIVAIRLRSDGSAGNVRLHANSGFGCDDFAFDIRGNIYCASTFDRVLVIDPNGGVSELLTAADDLDGPTSALFGVLPGERRDLYVTNAAFPFVSVRHRPSLMRVRVAFPGAER